MSIKTAFASKSPPNFRAPWAVFALIVLMSGQGWGLTPTATDEAPPTSFRVEVFGHGRPMILIPGYSSSGDTWKSTVAHSQNQYTCYVLTLAGFAGVPPITSPLLSTVRDELAVYIRQNHLEKPVIVGHSLGGTLALELAARFPELIGPLVIVDSLPFLAGPSFRVKKLEDAKAGIAAMRGYLSALTPDQRAENVRSAASFKYMVTNPSDLELLKQWGLATDPKTATEAMCELFNTDLRSDLSRISSPTLVLGTWIGLHEQIKQYSQNMHREDFIDTFREQYTNLLHLHFVMSDTARHFIMFDDPRWFFQQLDVFLADPMAAAADRGFGSK
jgi:pimeloyl-ACP methyl ester carboxylesterase